MYLHSATSPEKEIGSTGQMTHLIHAHPDILGQYSYLSADMIGTTTHLTVVSLVCTLHTILRCSFFLSILKFSLPFQSMRRKQLLQTPYQLNSVVSLSWKTSVWNFLLTAPDCPICFFSEPTSWADYIYIYFIPVSSCFLNLITTYSLISFLSFCVQTTKSCVIQDALFLAPNHFAV